MYSELTVSFNQQFDDLLMSLHRGNVQRCVSLEFKYKYDQNRINKAKGEITNKTNNTQQIIKLSLVLGLIIPLTIFLVYFTIKKIISSVNTTKSLKAKLNSLKTGGK